MAITSDSNAASERLADELARCYHESPLRSAFLVFQYDNNTIHQKDFKIVERAMINVETRLREEGYMFTTIMQGGEEK